MREMVLEPDTFGSSDACRRQPGLRYKWNTVLDL